MEKLFESFVLKLQRVPTGFVRSMMQTIQWDARLIGIKGARGVGKTTLLLQYIKQYLSKDLEKTLYVSLDSFWFSGSSLASLIDDFSRRGGQFLFLDEVHKYPGWAQTLKTAYDDYPDMKIVFTGSSALEILNARTDLSRRAIVYDMQGFSFREYISLETGHSFQSFKLDDILLHHIKIASDITTQIRPIQFFHSYLKTGYYPFYREQPDLYFQRLSEVLNMMLEIELPLLRGIDPAYVFKLKQLLSIIASSVPFVPNITKLSERIQINRNTLLSYLHYFEDVRLTNNLFKEGHGISLLQKPMKIFLENSNLMYLLSPVTVNIGSVRETFFRNQIGFLHDIRYAEKGDFLVNQRFTFEIGGREKTSEQIRGIQQAFVAADDVEIGFGNRIPLWLFGFLY